MKHWNTILSSTKLAITRNTNAINIFKILIHVNYTTVANIDFLLFFNRSRSITLYHLTYSQQKRCCSGYGPLPNCPRKIHVIDVQNIIIWYHNL